MPIQITAAATAAMPQFCPRWLPPFPPGITIVRNRYLSNGGVVTSDDEPKPGIDNGSKWHTLPTFVHTSDASDLGKYLVSNNKSLYFAKPAIVTAIKWVFQCIPQVPRSLVYKLFRLRKVRRYSCIEGNMAKSSAQSGQFRRVGAKDPMNIGDRICLPVTVEGDSPKKKKSVPSSEEINFIRSLVLYKDPALIAVNKPQGMPVQGGVGIQKSLDALAAACLRYQYPEPPRLVHRLDRESSGILILGRTRNSTTFLHSVFHEKTSKTSEDVCHPDKSVLHKKYWALVIGSPRRSSGFISAPLGKVVDSVSKYERIRVVDNPQEVPSQHAVTEYRIIESSPHGYTWLELSPLTGRKHQLRVHCAEVLGTPIVGDYKYGWEAHKKRVTDGGGVGVVLEKEPLLHLHCKQMVMPNVHLALCDSQLASGFDPCEESSLLRLATPLPPHMQRSWDLLRSSEPYNSLPQL